MDTNEKASSSDNATFDKARTQTAGRPILRESRNAGSQSVEAETLLQALRSVIIPLVRPADGEHKCDVKEIASGPDGNQFIIALQRFMTSFLHSQRGPVGGVEVDLNETSAIPIDYDEDSSGPESIFNADSPANSPSYNAHSSVYVTDSESERSQDQEGVDPKNKRSTLIGLRSPITAVISNRGLARLGGTLEQLRPRLIEKALKALREHVFNAMPIRLLHFKPHHSKLQITLIERGEIYACIASELQRRINIADVSRIISRLEKDKLLPKQRAEEAAIAQIIREYSRYAILSHTWLRGAAGEVTYGDWNGGEFDEHQPGYRKLLNFCKAAWEDHRVAFGWMDTVCINKESSSELDESIRSMYAWYRLAHVCVTYLAETVTLADMANDTWFTRGWTLQELLAPSQMKFYNADWKKLVESLENDKENFGVLKQIERATTITENELKWHILALPISRRMQMAAPRQVTREEDSAYSLMGIFGVSISTAYGEGSGRAFCRLLQEILNTTSFSVVDIFNWGGDDRSLISALLPSSPRLYLRRPTFQLLDIAMNPIEPLMLTHLGLRVTVVLMSAISIQNPALRYDSIGDYHAVTNVLAHTHYVSANKIIPGTYSVLDARTSLDDGWKEEQNWYQLPLGILNIGIMDDSVILVPTHCLAVGLYRDMGRPCKLPTEAPIIFTLNKRLRSNGNNAENSNKWNGYYRIERSELASHGMKLVTLHL
ncbi:hypothetical protein BJ912DRAFT_955073 [Pholiota molesta]|nr:hypothetical protein BJ912DRAFT_955073 [Pholiota molesta]